ncbi:histone-lysine N-methyltransferase SETD1A-like [Poecilia formosa]|uniref:histone-lysine N-methyltransferase SETD1A-like n=1 Tax=Poecilia formosa TaxID=48698 RepID=UPI0007BA6AD9|nr:PREDICTED: histone-lysine N-methyltransferase SETD1A-like [Poecilia formosa]
MKELRKSICRRSSSDSEKPYDFPVKQLCKFFEKENAKANEAEPRMVVEEEVLENNPSDSEAMNPELTASSSEHNILNKEDNPVEAEETKDALTGALNGNNGYKKATENTNPEDKRPVSNDPSDSGSPDEVPENQNSEKPYDLPVKQRCKIFEKEIGKANEAEPREVVEEEVLANNPSDSVAMNPELTALSSESNSGRKKEENEFEKSTPENDVQPPPVAKESSPLSQNSPESAPEAERKQDINPDECAKKSNGESSSSSSEESENEEQAPPASTAKETDSETTVEEQKPL